MHIKTARGKKVKCEFVTIMSKSMSWQTPCIKHWRNKHGQKNMYSRLLTGRKTLTLVISAVLLITFLASAHAYAQEKQIPIIVGGDHRFPPYQFLENGKPTGFNIELIQAVAKVMGLTVRIELGPWSEMRRQLEEGGVDVLAG